MDFWDSQVTEVHSQLWLDLGSLDGPVEEKLIYMVPGSYAGLQGPQIGSHIPISSSSSGLLTALCYRM
jgi:hypothetical protein